MALSFTIGGTNMLPYLDFRSVRIQQSREAKGSTLNFNLLHYDTPVPRPLAGQEVILSDGATREFGGVLLAVNRKMREANRLILYECQCMDYTYYFDRRFLNQVYAEQAADAMVTEILGDLLAASEADTHYTDFDTNDVTPHTDSGSTPIYIGPTIRRQRFERVLPSQALDIIAEASGMYWWIDFNKTLKLVPLATTLAPLPTNEEAAYPELLVDTDVENYANIEDEETIEGIGTKVVIRGAIIKSLSTQTDSQDWATGDAPYLYLSLRPFSELDITTVTRDGVVQTVLLENVDLQANEQPGSANNVALFVGPQNGTSRSYIRFRTADLVNGDTLIATYNYSTITDSEGIDPERTSIMQERTGGDGIHEFVFSQASEIAVVSQESLNEIENIILDRKALIHRRGQFTSFTKGWEAGQYFIIKWAKEGIEEQVYVINVTKKILTPHDEVTTGDNVIISTIQYSNIPRGMRM